MVADTGLGWAYPIRINLTDENGSPLTGAVTGGSLSLYGPASATSTVHTGTVAEIGNGDYGLTVPGTVNVVAGYYNWVIPTTTVGGYTFTNQTGGYSVGPIPPEYRTLRAIVVAVCEALGVGIASRSTSSGATTYLNDTRWDDDGIATNEFVGDEVLILEPGATTDTNPVRVIASDPTNGRLTFAPAVAGSVASGTDYLLLRPGKRGLRYAQIIEAIVAAVADLATRQKVTDEVTLRTVRGTREYDLPGGWLRVDKIEIAQQPTAWDPYWEELAPVYYVVWQDRQRVYIRHDFGGEYLLRLTGTVGVPEPRSLGALVKVPFTLARDLAVGYLSVPIEQRAGLAYRRASAAAARRSA